MMKCKDYCALIQSDRRATTHAVKFVIGLSICRVQRNETKETKQGLRILTQEIMLRMEAVSLMTHPSI